MSWNSGRHLRTTFGTVLNAAEMDELIRQNVVKKTRLPRRVHSEEPPIVPLDGLRSLLNELPEPSRSTTALIVLAGLRIGEMLGHTSSDVTREHYIHAVSSESRNAVGRIEELPIGPKWTQIECWTKSPKP